MKNKSIICALLLACGVGVSTTSCEDMLSADSDRTTHTNAQDSLYGYWGIMKAVQNLGERYVILGEARADLTYATSSAADTISNLANFKMVNDGDCRYLEVKDYYTVINSCNNYLADVDSLKTNSFGGKIMEKEVAQVLAVRAWTYLQLVNNYGEVPYYTDPITSLDFIDKFDFNKETNKLNRENLISKLAPALEAYRNVALPNYGNYNNGAKDIASTLTMFPVKLVLGDIYLTGALDQSHYEAAAKCYYEYLKDNGAYLPTQYTASADRFSLTGEVSYSGGSWADAFSSDASPVGSGYNGEAITVIPSSAGKLYGTVLTGVANVFGYRTNSTMDTDSEEGNESEATTSASVTAYPDPTYRQLGPSQQYLSLCKAQQYLIQEVETDPVEPLQDAGDARQAALIDVTTNSSAGFSSLQFIRKPCYSGFSYTFPVIYRKALVWLRYAEAINRAGFPSYAFAILKNGLCSDYLPVLQKDVEQEIENEDGTLDTILVDVYDTINKPCYYIPRAEYDKAQTKESYMKFTSEFTIKNETQAINIGVHARGCGLVGFADSLYYTYENKLAEAGVVYGKATLADSIDAVENMIVDELALETAWEGNRYPDLLRIASHKGDAGAHWFADKIARRGDPREPGVDYSKSAEYKAIYDYLKADKNNWYLKLPSYK